VNTALETFKRAQEELMREMPSVLPSNISVASYVDIVDVFFRTTGSDIKKTASPTDYYSYDMSHILQQTGYNVYLIFQSFMDSMKQLKKKMKTKKIKKLQKLINAPPEDTDLASALKRYTVDIRQFGESINFNAQGVSLKPHDKFKEDTLFLEEFFLPEFVFP
jgi:hypothetical protein